MGRKEREKERTGVSPAGDGNSDAARPLGGFHGEGGELGLEGCAWVIENTELC